MICQVLRDNFDESFFPFRALIYSLAIETSFSLAQRRREQSFHSQSDVIEQESY